MKTRSLILVTLLAILISCGNSKEEQRIHLEKIEVGKELTKIELNNELDRAKKLLDEAEKELDRIKQFQIGRSVETREKQISQQNSQIRIIQQYISSIEKEISLIPLNQTFEFQDSPKALVNYIFSAASSRNFSQLRYLCDPYGEHDSDTNGICRVEMSMKETQKQFISTFQNGRIMGKPLVYGIHADIEIAIGSNSDRLEKITLVKREDKWYLSSF